MMNLYDPQIQQQQQHPTMANNKKFSKFFPGKLRTMLDSVQALGLAHGISWVSDGCAFAIHDPNVYMTEIAPRFFCKQTHLRSFHRQLSIWGFTRLETGAGGRGVWFHKYFIRAKPELITRIKRVPVKHATSPKTAEEISNNPTMDYNNYRLNDKVVKAISYQDKDIPFLAEQMAKAKGKRPSLPMRKRSEEDVDGEDSKPSSTMNAAAGGAMNAGMMGAMEGNTPLQRLYASQEAAAAANLSPQSRMHPFILTGYQQSAAANMVGGRFPPQAFAPGAFMGRAAAANGMPQAGPQMDDELVARQLAGMGRAPTNPASAAIAAASASRPSMVSGDAALMARAMVMETERRRHQAMMQAQAQAQAAQAQAQAHAQAQAAQQQAQAMGMAGMPPATTNMGNDTDILAAIQQRKQFLSRLEADFKAKMASRGGNGGGM